MTTTSLSSAIDDYIASRRLNRSEAREKEADKRRKELADDPLALASFETEQTGLAQAEAGKFAPANWLDDAAKRAKKITLVTHAPKYTHGDAKGSGVLADPKLAKADYLCTASLPEKTLDVICDAKQLGIANFLLLEGNGESLMDFIRRGDGSPLRPFARDEAQLAVWLSGFKLALESGAPSSHPLAKQVYFPVADGYHLLGALFATSLTQALHQRIDSERFSEEAKAARAARRSKQTHSRPVVEFPQLAVQTFGGSKPLNISLLNSKRLKDKKGIAYLLNCQPPRWKEQEKPPADDPAFWRHYGYLVRHKVRELKYYLLCVVSSDSTLAIRDRRAELVAELVAELHQIAARIQCQTAGWSREKALGPAMAHWLDPHRDDADFIASRERNDWQQGIGEQFALWLNRQLQDTQLQMKDGEHSVWRKIVSRELRLLNDDLEVLA
jgi:CRISPR-associated protein Csy1